MMLKLSIYAQGWVIVVVLEVGAVKIYVAGVAKTVAKVDVKLRCYWEHTENHCQLGEPLGTW
jgi:hypothetical protein